MSGAANEGGLQMSRRIRRTPYTDRVEQSGVRGFSVLNHMLLPKAFQPSVEDDYWHLREHVQIWDVAAQRQVEIIGADAAHLVQMMTPRDLSKARIGQCLYVPLVDENGSMVNDPVMLKLAEDRYWLSVADSDVVLWAKGLAVGAGMSARVFEPDVSPLAIQGPKAEDLLAGLFGNHIREIGFFRYGWIEFQGTRQLLARSGYSRQGGFEIYLEDSALGSALWDMICEAGQDFSIRPGCPNLIERIEGGLHSYGNEFTRANNALECGFESMCQLDGSVECLALHALQKIAREGAGQRIVGLQFDGDRCPPCSQLWPVHANGVGVGNVTSAIWSPRLKTNVAQGMIMRGYWHAGQDITVQTPDGLTRMGRVVSFPMS